MMSIWQPGIFFVFWLDLGTFLYIFGISSEGIGGLDLSLVLLVSPPPQVCEFLAKIACLMSNYRLKVQNLTLISVDFGLI